MITVLLKAICTKEFLQLVLASLTMALMFAWRGYLRNAIFRAMLP